LKSSAAVAWASSTRPKRISFTALEPGKPWTIYGVPAEGGVAEPFLVEKRSLLSLVWSPDGKSIVFGRIRSRDEQLKIFVMDLGTRKISELPGSDGMWVPVWSADGQHLLTQSFDFHHLMLFDFKTQKWSELAAGVLGVFGFTNDGKSAYFHSQDDDGVYRVRLADRRKRRSPT
jgi:hypothetical protein